MNIIKIPKQYSKFIDEITEDGGQYFVWLKKPYAYEANPNENIASHCRGMYLNTNEIYEDIQSIEVCPCSYCNEDK